MRNRAVLPDQNGLPRPEIVAVSKPGSPGCPPSGSLPAKSLPALPNWLPIILIVAIVPLLALALGRWRAFAQLPAAFLLSLPLLLLVVLLIGVGVLFCLLLYLVRSSADGTQQLRQLNRILQIQMDAVERAQREVREEQAYTRSLIEASLDPLVTIAPDGKITDVNAATEAVTGCTRQ